MNKIAISAKKLEDDKLWQLASELAEFFYGQLTELPEEEKWGMESKLRQRSFQLTSDIAEGIGSIDPREKMYSYGLARRSLFGIKNVYSLANKTDDLKMDPEVMVKIEETTKLLDQEIMDASANIDAWYEEFENTAKGRK
jgi:four helix bundle protein